MGDIAIRVNGLSKQYHIGATRRSYTTLRETIKEAVLGAARSLRRNSTRPSDETMWALKDVSFEVKRGEVLGIIGRNGAGKSTLLKILSRITEPTCGEVDVYGRVASLLEVGTGFHPELTGRENIYLNGAVLGMRQREVQRKFDEIVDFSGIEKFIDTPVKHYSSGMYMRLAFSVAAHLEPEILMVDEVLAVGDAEFQKKCLGKMGAVATEGRTVLFVSHNLNAVEQLCQTAALLESGRLRLIDRDVRSVLKQYLFGDESTGPVAEWLNSGPQHRNPWYSPLRFFIADKQGGLQRMPISNTDECYVQIEGEVAQLDPALTVGYAIYAEDGALLYWSYQTDAPESDWPVLHVGRCTLRSRIPTRLLNEGTFRVELIASLHFRKWLMEPGVSAPHVLLIIQGGLSESPYWIAKRPGLLGPVLTWSLCE